MNDQLEATPTPHTINMNSQLNSIFGVLQSVVTALDTSITQTYLSDVKAN